MNYATFILSCCLALTFLTTISANELEDDLYNEMINTSKLGDNQGSCSRFFRSGLQKFWLLITGSYLDDGNQESQTKCWVTCMLKKLGLLDDQENVDPQAMLDRFSASPEEQERVKANMQFCMNTSKEGSTSCDKSYRFIRCMYTGRKNTNTPAETTEKTEPEEAGRDIET